jgi:hypothetical protein
MKLEMLHITQNEFKHYDLTVFWLHIDQGVQHCKHCAYHIAKKNKNLLGLGLPPPSPGTV